MNDETQSPAPEQKFPRRAVEAIEDAFVGNEYREKGSFFFYDGPPMPYLRETSPEEIGE